MYPNEMRKSGQSTPGVLVLGLIGGVFLGLTGAEGVKEMWVYSHE